MLLLLPLLLLVLLLLLFYDYYDYYVTIVCLYNKEVEVEGPKSCAKTLVIRFLSTVKITRSFKC